MTRRDRVRRHLAGFTLIEAIIAMVVTGIVAAIVAVFIARPIQGYLDTTRRAGMTDVADLALRRIALELRGAVPNSLRVGATGRYVEFIPTLDGGRYRAQRDGQPCSVVPAADPIHDADDCTSADNSRFDVLGPPVGGTAGDLVVIFNTGQSGLDAYAPGQNNRRTITAAGAKLAFEPKPAAPATPWPFPPYESPFQRFQVVPASGPVAFDCVTVAAPAGYGNLALQRFTGYRAGTDDWSGLPTAAAGGTRVLLASDLSDCRFDYQALSAADGLLVVRLAVTRDGETITLVHEIHVDNTP